MVTISLRIDIKNCAQNSCVDLEFRLLNIAPLLENKYYRLKRVSSPDNEREYT